jgi:chemotaxis protein methyltransferase CheR
MDPSLLRAFCDLVHEKAGITLTEAKEPLITARLAKRLRTLGLADERQYLDVLRGPSGDDELVHFLDAISTNFTSFFREPDHFEHVTQQVTAWLSEGRRKFRFWSVASSSGEEPYTLAIVLAEAFKGHDIDYRILGTDISTRVLALAREGTYTDAQVERIPGHLRQRYFARKTRGTAGGDTYQVVPELRQRTTFARLNLSAPPFPMTGPMDIAFCRNVMIYFDQPVRQALVGEIERVMAPGGLLMIGHSETLNGIRMGLRGVRASTFQKPAASEPQRMQAPRAAAGR